jgi:hypothetical protein
MSSVFVIFWTAMVFGSIAWYAFLLFYIGAKGGKEITEMTRTLAKRPEEEKKD